MLSVNLYWVYEPLLLCPTRDASPPLVLAFSGSGTFYHTTTTYTPNILHLTLIHYNSLIINTLLSVRCYKFYLHASYTPHMLPHGTSTGEGYHSIGEQKSLLLRLTFLRPSGVQPATYVQTDCKMQQGCVRYFEIILHA